MKALLVSLSCFAVGVILTPLCAWIYLDYGNPPVAIAHAAFPLENQIVRAPLHRRLESELQQPSLQPDEGNLLAGADIYKKECAFCYGLPGHASAVGRNMYPGALQLWEKHRSGIAGVSDDPPGATFRRSQNRIRLTGMPVYQISLSEPQLRQVSSLLASAAKP